MMSAPAPKPIHPQSRKAGHLSKQEAHEKRKAKQRQTAARGRTAVAQKLEWFQEQAKKTEQPQFTSTEICEMIAKYFERYDAELEAIEDKTDRFKNRPKSSRHHIISALIDMEKKEFMNAGFGATFSSEAPDLTNHGVVKRLREWTGDVGQIDSFAMRRFKPEREMILLGGGEAAITSQD